MAELAETQRKTEERIGLLEQRMAELAKTVAELGEAQKRTENTLINLIDLVRKHEDRLGKLDGRMLELTFAQKASAYLSTVMRRTRVIPAGDIGEDIENVLSPDEWAELARSDLILRGRAMFEGQWRQVYAVVKLSVTLDANDIARASRRAALLRKKGWKVLAIAAGDTADVQLLPTAAQLGVAVLEDGRQTNWTEALAAA